MSAPVRGDTPRSLALLPCRPENGSTATPMSASVFSLKSRTAGRRSGANTLDPGPSLSFIYSRQRTHRIKAEARTAQLSAISTSFLLLKLYLKRSAPPPTPREDRYRIDTVTTVRRDSSVAADPPSDSTGQKRTPMGMVVRGSDPTDDS